MRILLLNFVMTLMKLGVLSFLDSSSFGEETVESVQRLDKVEKGETYVLVAYFKYLLEVKKNKPSHNGQLTQN